MNSKYVYENYNSKKIADNIAGSVSLISVFGRGEEREVPYSFFISMYIM